MSSREGRGYTLAPGDGSPIWFLGGLLTWKASGAETAGQYELAEQLGAQGYMAPPHIHARESEGFFVLEGDVDVEIGEQSQIVTAGSFAFVPPGVRHAFRVVSPRARILTIVAPAGIRSFFEQAGVPATSFTLPPEPDGPPDLQRLGVLAARYGITMVDPGPSGRR
jgi:mannose-6-phosphate isomerase-like protein (cupin superfamily)